MCGKVRLGCKYFSNATVKWQKKYDKVLYKSGESVKKNFKKLLTSVKILFKVTNSVEAQVHDLGSFVNVELDCNIQVKQICPRNAAQGVHTLPPVVFGHAFIGLLQGEVALAGSPPVEGGDGLLPPILTQNLPVVDEALLKLLAVQQPIHHLKVRGSAPLWLDPALGRMESAVAVHFSFFFNRFCCSDLN